MHFWILQKKELSTNSWEVILPVDACTTSSWFIAIIFSFFKQKKVSTQGVSLHLLRKDINQPSDILQSLIKRWYKDLENWVCGLFATHYREVCLSRRPGVRRPRRKRRCCWPQGGRDALRVVAKLKQHNKNLDCQEVWTVTRPNISWRRGNVKQIRRRQTVKDETLNSTNLKLLLRHSISPH